MLLPSLTVLSGASTNARLELDEAVDEILIGSDAGCRLCIPDPGVSPIHARLWLDLEGATLHDTRSPYGVYVNDARVEGKASLRHGDVIWLGPPGAETSVKIRWSWPGREASESEAPPQVVEPGAPVEEPEPDVFAGEAEPAAELEVHPELEPVLEEALPPPAVVEEVEPEPVEELEPEPVEELEPEPVEELEPTDEVEGVVEVAPVLEPEPVPLVLEEREPPALALDDDLAGEPPPVTLPSPPEEPKETPVPPAPPPPPKPAEPAAPVPRPAAPRQEPPRPAPKAAAPVARPVRASEPAKGGSPKIYAVAAALLLAAAAGGFFLLGGTKPVLESVSPTRARVGQPVVLRGSGFATKTTENAVLFGDRTGRVVQASATELLAEVPDLAPPPGQDRPVQVAVRVGKNETARLALAVYAAPQLRSLSPAKAAPGEEVVIEGSGWAPGALVQVSAAQAEVLESTPTRIRFRVPAVDVGVAAPVVVGQGPDASNPLPLTIAAAETAPAEAPPQEPEAAPAMPAAAPVPTPTPAKVAAVAPPKVTSPPPSPAKAGPTPKPAMPQATPAAPPAAPPAKAPVELPKAARMAELLGQAESAMAAQKFEAAVQAYEEALRLEPQNAKALSGKSTAALAAAAAKKSFVPGRTVVLGAKADKGGPGGFDTADVSVQKSDFRGRIEFEASPVHPRPGDKYGIKIYVVNEGQKPIKLNGVTVTTTSNGAKSPSSAQPKAKEVGAGQRALVHEVSGTWGEGVTAWSLEIQVAANKSDSLKSQLSWK